MKRITPFLVAGALAALAVPGTALDEPHLTRPAALEGSALTWCGDVTQIEPEPSLLRDSPIYVGNPPTGKLQRWASRQPGYADLWIDRDNLGWIVVAFAEDATVRQAQIERRFPDLGAVAVPVEHTKAELRQAQRRLEQDMPQLLKSWSLGIDPSRNTVLLEAGALTRDVVAALEAAIGDDPICVSGFDPSALVADGPQPVSGDGWTLLGHRQSADGPFFRTGLASDQAQYEALWAAAGMPGTAPPVDLVEHVVVWFAAAHGSSCDLLRLDDVIVDDEASIVRPMIVMPDDPMGCTDDLAGAYQYLVALERERLPAAPFTTQLYAEWASEDRVVIETDLRAPGSAAGADDIYQEDPPPASTGVRSGGVVEVGFRSPFVMDVSCGATYLGELNGVHWVRARDDLPEAWRAKVTTSGEIVVSVLLKGGKEPRANATANGHTISFRPQRAAPSSACAEERPG